MPRANFSADLDAARLTDFDVDDRDVGLESADPGERLRRCPGLADDREIEVALKLDP